MTRTDLINKANEMLDHTIFDMEPRFGKASAKDVELYALGVADAIGEHHHEWLNVIVSEETGVSFE